MKRVWFWVKGPREPTQGLCGWWELAWPGELKVHHVATQLQIQDLAIRCVQKNIKKNKGVKDWPWWKLFTTVRPLIQVQLSEEQIRNKDVRDLQGQLGSWEGLHVYAGVLLVCLGLRCS